MCSDNFETICRMQLFPDLAERYILSCREAKGEKGKSERLPNIAGFCRFCGFGAAELERLKHDYPDSYSALLFAFEDEALNSDLSASVLSVYLKKRLGYDEPEAVGSSCEVEQLKLVFEHDIATDGE